MTNLITRYPALVVGIVIGVVIAGADFAGGASPGKAAVSLGIIIGYAVLITVVGRRSETASTLAGRPVDERWEHINLEASASALGVSSIVVLLGFIVSDATGGDWTPYALIACVMAVSYVGSLLILRARH